MANARLYIIKPLYRKTSSPSPLQMSKVHTLFPFKENSPEKSSFKPRKYANSLHPLQALSVVGFAVILAAANPAQYTQKTTTSTTLLQTTQPTTNITTISTTFLPATTNVAIPIPPSGVTGAVPTTRPNPYNHCPFLPIQTHCYFTAISFHSRIIEKNDFFLLGYNI